MDMRSSRQIRASERNLLNAFERELSQDDAKASEKRKVGAAGFHGQRGKTTAAEITHAGATDSAKSERRRARRHCRPARNGITRKIQLARRSRGSEKTTRAPATQNPIMTMVEASNGTEGWRHASSDVGPESPRGAFKNRSAKARPTPK